LNEAPRRRATLRIIGCVCCRICWCAGRGGCFPPPFCETSDGSCFCTWLTGGRMPLGRYAKWDFLSQDKAQLWSRRLAERLSLFYTTTWISILKL